MNIREMLAKAQAARDAAGEGSATWADIEGHQILLDALRAALFANADRLLRIEAAAREVCTADDALVVARSTDDAMSDLVIDAYVRTTNARVALRSALAEPEVTP